MPGPRTGPARWESEFTEKYHGATGDPAQPLSMYIDIIK
jgi:hypothetical protein